jgi:hypothetical protein
VNRLAVLEIVRLAAIRHGADGDQDAGDRAASVL